MKIIVGILFSIVSYTAFGQVWTYPPGSGTGTFNGAVSIGTSATPQSTLEVVGTGQFIRNPASVSYTTLRLYNDQNNLFRTLEIDYSGSQYPSPLTNGGPVGESGSITTTGFYPLSLGTNNTSRMVIAPNGFIGMGITEPSAPLHVSGAGINGEVNLLVHNTSGTYTYLSSLTNKSAIQTNKDFSIVTDYGGWSDKFTVTHQGNAGIGTAATNARLTVNGSIKVSDPTGWNIGFGMNADPPRNLSIDVVNSAVDTDPLELVYNRGAGVKVGSGAGADKFLKVYGTVYSKEVNVTLSVPGPDYVFEPTYNLLPLSEVESYIKANKHLPEVPSAKQMEEEGLNLKEMNLILLKKVEELTLHLIEANKRLDDQQKQISDLKSNKN
jgi:hypothetical protein